MKTMLAALCLLMLAPKSSFAQSGSLDPDFGSGGLLISDQVLNYDLQIQADHKLIIGGSILTNNDQKSDLMVERLLENGVVDSTFGLNGKAIINFDDLSTSAFPWEMVQACAILENGQIAVAGMKRPEGPWLPNKAIIALLHEDGSVNTSFGNLGRMIFEIAGFSIRNTGVERCPDQGFLFWVMMRVEGADYLSDIAFYKFKADGSPDLNFGPNGNGNMIVKFEPASPFLGQTTKAQLKVTASGKIVVAGTSGYQTLCVHQFNPDGSRDLSFGLEGQVDIVAGLYIQVRDMAIQSDGKIVLFGESRVAGDPVFTIIRLNTIGKPDPSWGQDGILLDDVGFYENVIYAADIQTDGKMLGSGWTIDSDGSFHWITARYNTNGTRDLDFGTDGVQETNIGNENEYAQKLVVAPDHSFYIVGSILVSSDFNWFLAKFLPGEYVKVHAPMPATGLEATVLPNIASSGQSLELRYTLKEMVPISAQLVDVNGKQLKSLLYNARESAGLHSSTIKLPEALLDGQYWIVLKAGSQQTSLPVLLKR